MACCKGPGYATPMDAMKNGKREELVYIPCIIPPQRRDKRPDYLATVDVNPESPDYCKVIHRLNLPYLADEVHHTGWNACSSCHDDESKVRNRLNMPCINTSRIYVIDTGTDIRAPRLFRIVEPSEMFERAGLSTPHTTHCLANGEVMISCMGDPQGNTKGYYKYVTRQSVAMLIIAQCLDRDKITTRFAKMDTYSSS